MNKFKKYILALLYFLSFIIWIITLVFCLLTFSSIGFIIITFLIIITGILLKNNHRKLLLITPFILIPILVVGTLLYNRITILSNWNKVKNDYELVNEFVIDYYDSMCEEECNIYFDEKYNWLKDSYHVDKLDLNDDLRNAIDNISNYHKRLNYHHQGLSYIKINTNQVRYISHIEAHPQFFVVYSRNGKSLSEYHFDCTYNECNSHLSGKWYQNNYEYHI